jgi:hypothetical protein
MRRRDFLSFLSVVSACPVTALAQSKAIPRIGIIGSLGQAAVDAFKDGLRERGFMAPPRVKHQEKAAVT